MNGVHRTDENRVPTSPSGPPSSPFIEDVSLPPSKFQTQSPTKSSISPEKSFGRPPLTEDALRANELARSTKSIDESNIDPSIRHAHEGDTLSTMAGGAGYAGMDDTCFSTFSAVPNTDMTRFANLCHSPSKKVNGSPVKIVEDEKRRFNHHTPSRNHRGGSPTPRKARDEDATDLLMDFSDHTPMNHRSPHRQTRQSPLKSGPRHDLASFAARQRTPSPAKHPLPPSTPGEARHLANLLDFDLTPAPTPRSIPSITARELESMKSNFLSQISSLTATLSGREAEVKALSNAVTDAERRVGEALEEVRNERGAKETLQHEKEGFETRQKEMQKVLKDVKEEIMASDREKDALLQRVQESEHQREVAEARAVEAEGKLEGIKSAQSPSNGQASNENYPNAEVEAAVTKVAKELHGLYKSKHETKVTALKKSYSDRWERKVKDLQSKVDELSRENEELRIGRDATMSGVVPAATISNPTEPNEHKAALAAHEKRIEEQKTKLELLEKELQQARDDLTASKKQAEGLEKQLSAARKEIEDLVNATEEMMLLSQSTSEPVNQPERPPSSSGGTTSQDIKSSLSRSFSGSSGLKAPGFGTGNGTYSGESRIGKLGTLPRERSGSSLGTRSGIMSNIERMGRGRGVE